MRIGNKNRTLLFLAAICLLPGFLFNCSAGTSPPSCHYTHIEPSIPPESDGSISLSNPYSGIDWSLYERHRTNLHAHTRESDGLYGPKRVIDAYHRKGYTILALTDHNTVTWPWEKFGRNPEELNMLAVKANEISDIHHIGSYFSNFDIEGQIFRTFLWTTGEPADIDEEYVFGKIGQKGGMAIFFHPGRYDHPPEYYAGLFRKYPHLVGMEVVNRKDRYPEDRTLWDNVLTMLMPERPVWGFSNDDSHLMRHVGHSYNIFLLPNLSEENLRKAMKAGHFYFSHGKKAPIINEIILDEDAGTIEIDASGYNRIIWITAKGRTVHQGEKLFFRNNPGISAYLRAKLIGDAGNSYTNPFGATKCIPEESSLNNAN